MIPFFKHKDSWAAWDNAQKTGVVNTSALPKGVVEDLKGYDESVFFLRGHHPFKFVD